MLRTFDWLSNGARHIVSWPLIGLALMFTTIGAALLRVAMWLVDYEEA